MNFRVKTLDNAYNVWDTIHINIFYETRQARYAHKHTG